MTLPVQVGVGDSQELNTTVRGLRMALCYEDHAGIVLRPLCESSYAIVTERLKKARVPWELLPKPDECTDLKYCMSCITMVQERFVRLGPMPIVVEGKQFRFVGATGIFITLAR